MSDAPPKSPPKLTGSLFQNVLAGRHDYGAEREVTAGLHNTLSCPHCGAARERDARGPLVCRYCGTALVASAPTTGGKR